MFNNSVPEFVSNLIISVNSRYQRRDVFKLNPCNDIKIIGAPCGFSGRFEDGSFSMKTKMKICSNLH